MIPWMGSIPLVYGNIPVITTTADPTGLAGRRNSTTQVMKGNIRSQQARWIAHAEPMTSVTTHVAKPIHATLMLGRPARLAVIEHLQAALSLLG